MVMAVIKLTGLTATDAERAIAHIWYVLEQRDIETPRVETRRDRGNRVNILVTFGSQPDADTVLTALQGQWARIAHVPAGRHMPV